MGLTLMKHLFHILQSIATYEILLLALADHADISGDACAVTTEKPARPPSPADALLADGQSSSPGCSGRSWWWHRRVAVVAWLWSNTVHNLSVRRISTGFAFLGREAGMPIADTWLPYSPKDTYLRAFIVGIANTLRVAVIGIVLATVLGTLVGIARLSPTGCCRGLPPSMSKCCATSRCCCNCCSGTC